MIEIDENTPQPTVRQFQDTIATLKPENWNTNIGQALQFAKEAVEGKISKVISHEHEITSLRMEKIECYVPIRGSPCIKTSIRQEAVHDAQDAFVDV